VCFRSVVLLDDLFRVRRCIVDQFFKFTAFYEAIISLNDDGFCKMVSLLVSCWFGEWLGVLLND